MGTDDAETRSPAELSDDELLAEIMRRRRMRGVAVPLVDDDPNRLSPTEKARHLASLELSPHATLHDAERALERLRARYAPFTRHDDPARRAAAQQLLSSLETAFEALRKHFTR